ncbi:phosphoribosylanthranilate isomerase [Acidithiobacillus concretivorus]|uniref:N-(5'-phosphoribosyl)anthranilate isomerase n=1 Tax=Acidithiobacillus concretivorus TaxID=3063952 RepID=A0ABS5ZS80_9PROT|nr:phosphoribosylanthranilate isomerase [Acidithiobacillus concretivorus]MBU2739355.1 phosphoribosylanthranilate isomerase [Acidithiobacillus concretivorus]
MIRAKICGITHVDDAVAAARVGADAVGLVFYEKSPRAVSVSRAREILQALPPFVSSVGLFVNADPATIERVLDGCPLDTLQFHGDEPPDFCRRFGRPYLKVLRVSGEEDLRRPVDDYFDAQGLLLDCAVAGHWGGSGQSFAWWKLPDLGKPLILAGGLRADNVQEAIRVACPYAVDVSSGVEQSPGIKDHDKMGQFMAQLQGF